VKILADSSIWIDYFRSGFKSQLLDYFIEQDTIVTNDLILAELIPSLVLKNFKTVTVKLKLIEKLPLEINWEDIINTQTGCLRNGYNGIGIPDLIIAQNSIQNKTPLYTIDGHFKKISKLNKLELV